MKDKKIKYELRKKTSNGTQTTTYVYKYKLEQDIKFILSKKSEVSWFEVIIL